MNDDWNGWISRQGDKVMFCLKNPDWKPSDEEWLLPAGPDAWIVLPAAFQLGFELRENNPLRVKLSIEVRETER